MHVVVFGDSIAKGVVTSRGKIETVEDNAVKMISDFYKLSIDNISFYGQTMKRIYKKKIVDNYLESIEHQDKIYVVFALGGNDSDYDWKKIAENPYLNHKPKTSLNEFEDLLIEMIEDLKSKGITVILTTVVPIDSQAYFDNVISKTGDPEQIMIFLHQDVENISRHQEAYSSLILKCAAKTNSIVLDVRSKMLVEGAMSQYMCKDGVHPNEKGYKYLADAIIYEITKYESFDKWSNTNRLYQERGYNIELE